MLLVQARQPAWVEQRGPRRVVARAADGAARGGLFATGALWAFMPCGLLYSALLVASLERRAAGRRVLHGAVRHRQRRPLGLAPRLLRRLRRAGNSLRQDWGTRVAGGLLVLAAGWALWMDLAQRIAQWCGIDV